MTAPSPLGAGVRAVLFDLDGTLIDSAPDLAGAANEMRIARGVTPLPEAALRPLVGTGARGMVRRALGVRPEDDGYAELRDEFLGRYEARMTQQTFVFPEVHPLLAALQQLGLPWGIVTNKIARFSEPLVKSLGLWAAAATVVSGDTTPHAKPHPAPLLEAARRLRVAPGACVYVGDDHRDIVAGRAAGMQVVAAAWGYLGDGVRIDEWGADHVIETPLALLNLLAMP